MNVEALTDPAQINEYMNLNFQKMRKMIISDLNSNYAASSIFLKRYNRDQIEKALLSPDKSVKQLQEMSEFLYNTSPHYKRLIDYMSELSCDNYTLSPIEYVIENEDEFKDSYFSAAKSYSLVSFKNINPVIRHEVFLKGIFCGICFEAKNSFCLKKLDINYCKISSVEDGTPIFSFDLDYFNAKAHFMLIEQFGLDFVKAYRIYKGDEERGIEPDKTKRWFEPKNQVCVKLDNSVLEYSLPYFIGLFSAILEIDVYNEIKKDNAIMNNYKVLAMQMATDEYGIPTMKFSDAEKYYNQAAANLPEGVGLIMTPFKIEEFSLQNNKSTDGDLAEDATKQFWANSGVNPMLFGIGANPTSAVLELSIRTDECIVFTVDENIAKAFNTRFKRNHNINDHIFIIAFLPQSIFNKTTLIDSLTKGCTYGLPLKSQLLAAYGLEPYQVLTMSNLEDNILGFTKTMLNTPLLQSSTMSPDKGEVGRPSNESKGLGDSDSTELGKDNNTENR